MFIHARLRTNLLRTERIGNKRDIEMSQGTDEFGESSEGRDGNRWWFGSAKSIVYAWQKSRVISLKAVS